MHLAIILNKELLGPEVGLQEKFTTKITNFLGSRLKEASTSDGLLRTHNADAQGLTIYVIRRLYIY